MAEILKDHNDGSCYKLTIEFTDFDVTYTPYIRYCEDFIELLNHGIEKKKIIEKNNVAVIDFRIQFDGK